MQIARDLLMAVSPECSDIAQNGKKRVTYCLDEAYSSTYANPCFDNAGNCYVLRTVNRDLQVIKFNSSGLFQWRLTISTTVTEKFVGIGGGGGWTPDEYFTIRLINDDKLFVYSRLYENVFSYQSGYALIGVSSEGSVTFAKRHSNIQTSNFSYITDQVQWGYNEVRNVIFSISRETRVENTPTAFLNYVEYSVDTGEMTRRILLSPTDKSQYGNPWGISPQVLGCALRPNGNVSFAAVGTGQDTALFELDSGSASVVRGRHTHWSESYPNGRFTNLFYRPDNNGYLVSVGEGYIGELDSDFNITSMKKVNLGGNPVLPTFVAQFGSLLIVKGWPYGGISFAQVNLSSGRVLWHSSFSAVQSSTTIGWVCDKTATKVVTLPVGNGASWVTGNPRIGLSDMLLPKIGVPLTTPDPPNVTFNGSTDYCPPLYLEEYSHQINSVSESWIATLTSNIGSSNLSYTATLSPMNWELTIEP